MVGAHQNLNGLRYLAWPRPFQGLFAIHGLALATISLSIKFEVSISTHHVDITGDTKCRKLGGLG